MPIKVRFGDSRGHVLATLLDPGNTMHRLPTAEDESFRLANTIDWYDKTVLSSADMHEFLEELDRVLADTRDADDIRFIRTLRDLAARCSRELGSSLEFVGD
jgi:hypothetical protein